MNDQFNEDGLVSAQDYSGVLDSAVFPELEKVRENLTVTGKGGVPLFCSVFRADSSRGTVLVLHGFTENAYKYSELIYSLLQNRFSVVAYDQRGHGRSGRAEGLSNPSVTHVDRLEDYVADVETVCSRILSGLPKPWTIFAHSMGGAVASLFLEKNPGVFSAAALCSPMIGPNTAGIPAFAVKGLCRAACLSGLGKRNPFFMKPYSGPEPFESSCATDPVRFAWYDSLKASREDFQNSVPSYRWILESINVTSKILSPGAPESISCPVLLTSAETDSSVMPLPQKKFIERVPNGRYIFVKGARHEIFRSVNSVFFPWWHEILLFLKEAKA